MRPIALIALAVAFTACSRTAPPPTPADEQRMREKASEDYRRPTYQHAPEKSYEP